MQAVYTALFTTDEKDHSVNVQFPDLPGCVTFGWNMSEALEMAQDAINQVLVVMEDHNDEIPAPTPLAEIEVPSGSIASMIAVDTVACRKKYNGKSVRKNVSLPAWLADKADTMNINLSQMLQKALLETIEPAH